MATQTFLQKVAEACGSSNLANCAIEELPCLKEMEGLCENFPSELSGLNPPACVFGEFEKNLGKFAAEEGGECGDLTVSSSRIERAARLTVGWFEFVQEAFGSEIPDAMMPVRFPDVR